MPNNYQARDMGSQNGTDKRQAIMTQPRKHGNSTIEAVVRFAQQVWTLTVIVPWYLRWMHAQTDLAAPRQLSNLEPARRTQLACTSRNSMWRLAVFGCFSFSFGLFRWLEATGLVV